MTLPGRWRYEDQDFKANLSWFGPDSKNQTNQLVNVACMPEHEVLSLENRAHMNLNPIFNLSQLRDPRQNTSLNFIYNIYKKTQYLLGDGDTHL